MDKPANRVRKRRNVITAVILIAAVCLIVFGIYSDEASEVFQKAVKICLECIGAG